MSGHRLESVPLSSLVPHPKNPRGTLAPAAIAELAASIKEQGLITPLIVAGKKPPYTIVCGHVRAAAAKLLGLEAVECCIAFPDVSLEDLEPLVLSDNVHHVGVDPFRQARLVRDLVGRMDAATVARSLGKPIGWVSRQRAIADLHPKVLDAVARDRAKFLSDPNAREPWSDEALFELAALTPDAQLAFFKECSRYGGTTGASEVRRHVNDSLRVVGKAPWKAEDALLVPKAGACSRCTKTSISFPGLFGDDDTEKDVAHARCRDAACWEIKIAAFAAREMEALKKKHGKSAVIFDDNASEARRRGKLVGLPVLDRWDVRPAKEGDKGALAVVKVSRDSVSTAFVRPSSRAEGNGSARGESKQKKADAPLSLAQREAALKLRRDAAFVDEVSGALHALGEKTDPGLKLPDARIVRLVGRYGLREEFMPQRFHYSGNEFPCRKDRLAAAMSDVVARQVVTRGVLRAAAHGLKRCGVPTALARELADVMRASRVDFVGVISAPAELRAKIEKDIPAPKALLEMRSAAAKKKPAAKAAPARRKKVAQ